MHLLTGSALYCGECVGRRAPSQVGTCVQNCRSPTLLSAFVIAVVLKPHTLSPCRLPEDGVSREHTYLFAQALMSVLAQEEQGGSAVRRAAQEVQRFAQER